jgi:precorrin-3B synthase
VCDPVRVLDQTLPAAPRRRPDRCPGITRPWLADDGALVRVRLVGGTLGTAALAALVDLAAVFGDGDVHLTQRANLQLRAVPHDDGRLPETFVDGVRAAGLLPSTSHELVRNVMTSALSGRVGGRADLRPVAASLDALLLADPDCAHLAGRFLFLLDDGRGDLLDRTSDVAVVALDATHGQLRAGTDQWGPVVPLDRAAGAMHDLTRRFLSARGTGTTACWHVDELADPLLTGERDPRARVTSGRPSYGVQVQGDGRLVEHHDVPDGRLTPDHAARLLARAADEVVVTRWRSVLLPDLET